MSKQIPIIEMLNRYCDLLVSTGTETVPHTGEVIWTGLVKQMEYVRVCEQIQRLRAGESDWQPIETAPESTRILVREGDDIYAAELYQSPYGARVWSSYCGQPVVYPPEPDHWMPLPAPPNVEDKE